MNIGDKLYTYDTNRRRFVDDEGQPARYANPRSYWQEHTITGETAGMWLLDDKEEYKVNKRTLKVTARFRSMALDALAYTPEQKADREWRDLNYARILDAVRVADVAQLRAIAAILDAAPAVEG